jgi:hypothetical protein
MARSIHGMISSRAAFLALALATIVIGLTIHRGGSALGAKTRDVLGDALWAAMMTWMLGALAPTMRRRVRGALALTVCYAVELSQLCHTPMLDAVRRTLVGRLVLGSGFDPRDLAAYAAGVLAAMLCERALWPHRTPHTR